MEPFIFELGNRANKVEILRKDDRIEIKAKGWLGKKNWREINEVLLRNGFEWLSDPFFFRSLVIIFRNLSSGQKTVYVFFYSCF
jgi:hypothetical protein